MEGRHLKPQYLIFFSATILGHGSCILVHYSRHIYNSKLENHLCLEYHLKNCKTERRNCVINNRPQLFGLSSLYTRANITRDSSARSRPLRFHLTTGSRRIPPHVMFFSDRICSICKPVISVNHSLAKMCFPLPRVHMCLYCGGRQKLWLTVVRNKVLAATETTGRLHAHISHLYRKISGSTHKGRRRLIVLGTNSSPVSRLFMLMCNL